VVLGRGVVVVGAQGDRLVVPVVGDGRLACGVLGVLAGVLLADAPGQGDGGEQAAGERGQPGGFASVRQGLGRYFTVPVRRSRP